MVLPIAVIGFLFDLLNGAFDSELPHIKSYPRAYEKGIVDS